MGKTSTNDSDCTEFWPLLSRAGCYFRLFRLTTSIFVGDRRWAGQGCRNDQRRAAPARLCPPLRRRSTGSARRPDMGGGIDSSRHGATSKLDERSPQRPPSLPLAPPQRERRGDVARERGRRPPQPAVPTHAPENGRRPPAGRPPATRALLAVTLQTSTWCLPIERAAVVAGRVRSPSTLDEILYSMAGAGQPRGQTSLSPVLRLESGIVSIARTEYCGRGFGGTLLCRSAHRHV